MNWVKLPVIEKIFQTFDVVFMKVLTIQQRFRMTVFARLIFPELQTLVVNLYMADNYGDFSQEAQEAHEYLMWYRARNNPKFKKLLKIDVDLEE